MGRFSPEEEKRKKAIFEGMSARRQKKILDKGYDDWDPFLRPKDPLDLRMDQNRKTALTLVREFLQTCSHEKYSNAYGRGAWDMCMGVISGSDRYRGMYDFSRWHQSFMENDKL